jgi:SAM-dependent methyltransferase
MTEHGDELVERQKDHFNSIADRYHKARQGQNHLYLKRRMWNDVFADLGDFKGRQIDMLEPMCGFCDGLDIISRHLTPNVRYKGFDYSDSVVETVRRERPGIDVWQADVTKYLPEEYAFDLIVIIGGLHHTPRDAARIVRNLAPALRPGGMLVNFEPTHGNAIFKSVRDQVYRRNSLFDDHTEQAFAIRDLLGMFEGAGLRMRKILYPGLLSYVLYYNPDAFPFLNIGGRSLVAATYALDKLFYKNALGRTLSFATLSVWTKP